MKSVFALAALAGIAMSANAQLINEFQPNPNGSDPATMSFEFLGNAGDSFSATLYSLDSDFDTGTVDRKYDINGVFDANGLLVVSGLADLENPSFTLILASDNSINIGDVVDAAADGTVDLSFGTVYDAINIADAAADNRGWASQFGGVEAYTGDEPMMAFRDGTTQQWWFVNDPSNGLVSDADGNTLGGHGFDSNPTGVGYNSFGGVNASIPTPGAAALLGLGGLVATRRRRA